MLYIHYPSNPLQKSMWKVSGKLFKIIQRVSRGAGMQPKPGGERPLLSPLHHATSLFLYSSFFLYTLWNILCMYNTRYNSYNIKSPLGWKLLELSMCLILSKIRLLFRVKKNLCQVNLLGEWGLLDSLTEMLAGWFWFWFWFWLWSVWRMDYPKIPRGGKQPKLPLWNIPMPLPH